MVSWMGGLEGGGGVVVVHAGGRRRVLAYRAASNWASDDILNKVSLPAMLRWGEVVGRVGGSSSIECCS